MAEHPAFWLIRQLHGTLSLPDWFINIRAIVNLAPYEKDGETIRNGTRVVFNENIRVADFKQRWYGGLLNHMIQFNEASKEPANIYFGVNPRSADSNKAEDVAGYVALYLDLDDNKSYTKDQRLIQMQFWKDYGIGNSVIVDSGHGYHGYWMMKRLIACGTGQPVLKKMVLLSGCKDKGNVHDPTRILRLPGFKNVKSWHTNDVPFCTLIEPANYESIDVLRYDLQTFDYWFPSSERENIEDYHARAVALGEGAPLHDRIRQIAQAAIQAKVQQKVINDGIAVNQRAENTTGTLEFQAKTLPGNASTSAEPTLVPKRKVVPPIEELKWPKGKSWLKKYCVRGWDGLTIWEREDIAEKLNIEEIGASEMDARVVYHLIKMGYTYDAVCEFWLRPSLKLNREGKHSKYLELTYEKQLEFARSTLTQDAAEEKLQATKPASILIKNFQTIVIKSNGVPETIVTAELVLQGKYYDEDAPEQMDREWFDIRANVSTPHGPQHFDMVLPGAAFTSVALFKKHACREYLRIPTNDGAHLQRLVEHLEHTYTNVPRRQFHSKIVYKDRQFVFPKFTITKDGPVVKEDAALIKELSNKFIIYKWFEPEFMTQDEAKIFIRENWKPLLNFHLPRVIISILGTIASSAMKPIFEQDLKVNDFHLPSINVRGSSHSGKTETVKKLLSLACVVGGQNTTSLNSTEFALGRTLEVTNFIPLIIDEFKLEEGNAKRIDQVRSLVRRAYSGEAMMRGRADLGIKSISLHGALIIVGEHALERVGDVSEISRVVPITTDEYEPDKHINEYFIVNKAAWHKLAPLFYQYVLTIDPQKVLAAFEQLRLKVISKLHGSFSGEKLRVGHNLATIWLGCTLWDRFIQTLWPEAPTIENTLRPEHTLIDYIKGWAKESKQTLVAKTETGEDIVIANNEFFKMLITFVEIKETYDKLFTENIDFTYYCAKEHNKLYIKISSIYKMYREYMQRQNKPIPEERKISSLLTAAAAKKEKWLICNSSTKRIPKFQKPQRVVTLDLKVLMEMDVWPNEDLNLKDATGIDENEKTPSTVEKLLDLYKIPPNTAPNEV